VRVERGAVFSGNGLVEKNLISQGLIIPGLSAAPGSVLTVIGNVESRGELLFTLENRGKANLLRVGGTADIAGTVVHLSGMAGGALPANAYDIIQAGVLSGAPINDSAMAQQGVTLLHSFDLGAGGNSLRASYAGSQVLPQTKALSEGFLAGAALVNLGADLAAGPGMSEAVKAAEAGTAEGAAFGAVSGGWSRYNSGSHVDMSSLSLLAGLAWGQAFAPGHLTLGVFVEYGNGSYDTYNSFSNAASVHGNGNTRHIGGGILGRLDFTGAGPGHFYTEASGRAGGVSNEYSSSELRDPWGQGASYESSSAYYGFHAGAGYVWNLADQVSFDVYGKYFWTRQEGDFLTLSSGDPVDFSAADSSRLRLGGRFSYVVNQYVSPYIGAAWEYEFGGEIQASSNGYAIDPPSLGGGSGIGELGLSFKPSPALPLSIDLGVQGYAGQREGVTGTLQAKVEF
jgi:outer membrane autotransporter protein